MKKKEDKKKDIESLRQDLQASQNLFVTGYEKLKVGRISNCGRRCGRPAGNIAW